VGDERNALGFFNMLSNLLMVVVSVLGSPRGGGVGLSSSLALSQLFSNPRNPYEFPSASKGSTGVWVANRTTACEGLHWHVLHGG